MNFKLEQVGAIDIISVGGRLAFDASAEFEANLREAVNEAVRNKVILDFEGVTFISSPVLRSILSLAKRLSRHGSKLFVIGASEEVIEVFRVSGFTKLKVFELGDRETAIRSLDAVPEPSGDRAVSKPKASSFSMPPLPAVSRDPGSDDESSGNSDAAAVAKAQAAAKAQADAAAAAAAAKAKAMAAAEAARAKEEAEAKAAAAAAKAEEDARANAAAEAAAAEAAAARAEEEAKAQAATATAATAAAAAAAKAEDDARANAAAATAKAEEAAKAKAAAEAARAVEEARAEAAAAALKAEEETKAQVAAAAAKAQEEEKAQVAKAAAAKAEEAVKAQAAAEAARLKAVAVDEVKKPTPVDEPAKDRDKAEAVAPPPLPENVGEKPQPKAQPAPVAVAVEKETAVGADVESNLGLVGSIVYAIKYWLGRVGEKDDKPSRKKGEKEHDSRKVAPEPTPLKTDEILDQIRDAEQGGLVFQLKEAFAYWASKLFPKKK